MATTHSYNASKLALSHLWPYRPSTIPIVIILSRNRIRLYPNQVFGLCFKTQSLNQKRTSREALTRPLTCSCPHTHHASLTDAQRTMNIHSSATLRPNDSPLLGFGYTLPFHKTLKIPNPSHNLMIQIANYLSSLELAFH